MIGPTFLRLSLLTVAFAFCADATSAMQTNATQDEMMAWMGILTGVSLMVFVGFAMRGYGLFAALAALFLLGSAARLWMTQPLWFPKLDLSTDTATLMMLGILGAQTVLTGYVLVTRWPAAAWQGLRDFGYGRILILLVLVTVFTVSPTNYVAFGHYFPYLKQTLAGGLISTMQLATVMAMFLVAGPSHVPRVPPLGLAIFAFVASALLAWFAFERVPHVEDEVAYLFQARTFAGGALTVPAPPVEAQPALEYYLLDIRGDRWLSVVAPGWPGILSLGVLIGMPWIVNPALTGASVWLAHGILRNTVGTTRADVVGLLMASSPWVLAIGASMMAHAAGLFLALLGWWLLLRPVTDRSGKAAVLAFGAGLAMGWLFTTRPLEGILIGGLTGLWLLLDFRGNIARIILYGLGCFAAGSTFFLFNLATTGDLLLTPQADYINRLWPGAGNTFGFGPDIGPPAGDWLALDIWPGHSPAEGLLNTLNGFAFMNFEFLGWTFGSLTALWAAVLWFRHPTGFDKAMLALLVVVIGVMFFYWYTGTFFIGPRYWYVALLPFLTLSAAGLLEVRLRLSETGQQRFSVVLLFLCAVSLMVFTPWRGVAKYHGYLGYTSEIRDLEQRENLTNALVFVATSGDIGLAFYRLDPFLSSDRPIYVRDLGSEANQATIAAFPGRELIYVTVDG
ncbi:hypothetical protein [Ruegeria sp.]|uniref:hypothetical protein n=1 Tax=Ruegeria sp. TaxID=1879320 RepID=UPI003B58C2DA